MPIIRLIILVIITVALAFAGYHFFGTAGAIGGTLAGIAIIVLGGRI